MQASPKDGGASAGALYAVGAYLCWGLFPLYWKPLHGIPAFEILCHRVFWSALFVAALLVATRGAGPLLASLRDPRRVGVFALSSLMLSANWMLYIWAVNSGHVVESSLGYFINPLFNVFLGRMVLGERLGRVQAVSVALAAVGVIWLTVRLGQVPWIALALAASFGLYGLLRKRAPLPSLQGLALETFLMLPVAAGVLLWCEASGIGHFGHVSLPENLLLAGAGVVTAVPLLMFAAAARRLTLTSLGLVQYISPTMQLLLGVLLFGEPFGGDRLAGFAFIWAGLLLYSGHSLLRFARRPAAA
ncbi:EamA family transporter RarD [Paludibacterium paludis]|nr:EamA family transporter RarD [Paludibacterium paludis]